MKAVGKPSKNSSRRPSVMIFRRTSVSFIVVGVCTIGSPAWTCDQAAGVAVASQVTKDFATLVGFTKASCSPASDGAQCSLVCFSDLNIVGDNRNLVLTVITASAGKRMRDAGLSKFARVSFADRELLQARKALTLSAAAASQLQQTLSASTA